MNYYEHHLGDYAEATAHLSLLEDAVYSRLIRKYYASEAPIPADLSVVQRLVGARSKEERAAVKVVLEEFFYPNGDGCWHNKRCDAELLRFREKKAKAKGSANARWEQVRLEDERIANALRTHSEPDANALPTHCEGNALQSPIPSPQSPSKESRVSSPSDSHSATAEIFAHWCLVWNHPKSALDTKRMTVIQRALKLGYSADGLRNCISGYRNSPHHTGQNDKQTVYDEIGLLLRDAAHIDAGIRFYEHAAPSARSELTNHNLAALTEWAAKDDDAQHRPSALPSHHGDARRDLRQEALPADGGDLLDRLEDSRRRAGG